MNLDRRKLRAANRVRRRKLNSEQQRFACRQIIRQLRQQYRYIKAHSVALYWPFDGEADIMPLHLDSTKSWFVPLVSNRLRRWQPTHLLFQRFIPNTANTSRNQFNIIEPRYKPEKLIRAKMLDIVLLPLVAFDRDGNRLGMGMGYYDRTFKNSTRVWHRPRLIGIAHSFQECRCLIPQTWDVPMDLIITEKEVIICSP